jgi:hypothetical protein
MKRFSIILLAGLAGACNGTTGSALVSFSALAQGSGDIAASTAFTTGSGFSVQLTRATLHIAALYLNESVPTSGAQESSCVLPGIYVAQVFGPVDLDLLSQAPVAFPTPGEATETHAATAEVWLAGGAIDEPDDATVILDVAGAAARDGTVWPFVGSVTIGTNRALPVQNPATPGANPICHQRIVTPIVVDLTPKNGGELSLRVDPRGMWNGVDFSLLTADNLSPDGGPVYRIPDENGGIGGALFKGLVANAGVYSFSWNETGGPQ